MAPLPRVTVIVPVWNGAGTLSACLDAIGAQTYARDQIQLLVVDNGSTDATPQILAGYSGLTLLHESEPGSYAARNRGIAAADGDYIAFTDADCIPEPGWLDSAIAATRTHPHAGIIGGRIELFSTEGNSELCRAYETLLSFDQQTYINDGHCATANWLSPRLLLQSLQGFDARLKSGGDFELAQRIRAAGHPLVYCAAMQVRHPCRGSFSALLSKRRRTTGGQWSMRRSASHKLSYTVGIGKQAAREWRRFLRERGLTLTERMSLCGLSAALAGAQYAELVSLMLGSAPRRA